MEYSCIIVVSVFVDGVVEVNELHWATNPTGATTTPNARLLNHIFFNIEKLPLVGLFKFVKF